MQVHISAPKEIVELMKKAAHAHQMTLSEYIRWLVMKEEENVSE